MQPIRTCADCGAPLPEDAPEGRCPVCALKGALDLSAGAAEVVLTERCGDHIGRYRLLERIGEGGFGVVYLAEQEAPLRRQVALKIVKLGMDTKQVIARFEAERQALALMDHPNIARVFDAGATDTGRPYFVMELVRGVRITDYCDENNLSTRDRLVLFMQICHAVQHAHQKGIIHRDLKPSNILVAQLDGIAVPRVIDFGIAKATATQEAKDPTLLTALDQFLGTPAYMSPEQVDRSHLDMDTRSDIYSLGVLLYELLTGRLPFEQKEILQAGMDEMRRVIREQEPLKPSTRLSTLAAEDLRVVAKRRNVEPPKLVPLVRGDLDWIVMKCLEKERGRRYATADALREDLGHHLNHEPVEAAAPGTAYRMGKFVRRHRYGFATAAAIVLLLLAGMAVSTWQTVRAKRAERLVRTVATFLEDTLKSVTPEQAKGRDTTLMRELLDKAAVRLDEELKEQPLIQAWLRSVLGDVYRRLGEYPKTETLYLKALETFERMLGKEHPDTLTSVNNLAMLMLDKGDFARAELLLRPAVEVQERTLGREHPNTLSSANTLAAALHRKGDYAKAEQLYRRVLEANERRLGKEHPDTLVSVNNLSTLLQEKGDLAEAELLEHRALEANERTLGKEHPLTLASVNSLAVLLAAKGDSAEAERLYRRALEAQERTLGREHPETLGTAISLAGLLVDAGGDYAEAEQLLRQALEVQERTLAKEHPHTLISAHNLAVLLFKRGDYVEAERLHRRVLEARERTLGKDHPDTLTSMHSLAVLLAAKGDNAEAELLHRRVLETRERTLGKDHPHTLISADRLASLMEAKGDLTGAESLFRQALRASEAKLGKEHPVTLAIKSNLATLLAKKGDHDEAEALFRGTLPAQKKVLGTNHLNLAWSFSRFGNVLEKRNKLEEAENAYRESLTILRAAGGLDYPQVGGIIQLLVNLLAQQGKFTEAHRVLDELLSFAGESRPQQADLLLTRGHLAARQGRFQEAVADLTKALGARPYDHLVYLWLAPAVVASGDIDGYRRCCQGILTRFAGTNEPTVADRMAKACLIVPISGVDLEEVGKMARIAVTEGKTNSFLPYFQFVMGLAEYRQGRFASAVEWLQKALANRQWPDDQRDVQANMVLAMAQCQLKQIEDARKTLATGTDLASRKLPKADSGDLGYYWHDRILADALMLEAKTLIGNK